MTLSLLHGRRVAVTGGTSGLGLALVRELRRRGARRRLRRADGRPRRRRRREYAGAYGIVGDVSRKEDIYPDRDADHRRARRARRARQQRLVAGPCSAGARSPTPTARTSSAALATNVVGPFRLTKALLGALAASAREGARRRWCSTSRAMPPINALSRLGCLRREQGGAASPERASGARSSSADGIRLRRIDPGDMDTPLHALAVPDADRATLKRPGDAAVETRRRRSRRALPRDRWRALSARPRRCPDDRGQRPAQRGRATPRRRRRRPHRPSPCARSAGACAGGRRRRRQRRRDAARQPHGDARADGGRHRGAARRAPLAGAAASARVSPRWRSARATIARRPRTDRRRLRRTPAIDCGSARSSAVVERVLGHPRLIVAGVRRIARGHLERHGPARAADPVRARAAAAGACGTCGRRSPARRWPSSRRRPASCSTGPPWSGCASAVSAFAHADPRGRASRRRATRPSTRCCRSTSPTAIPAATAAAIDAARTAGGRVIAIGTTVVRALEHAALPRRTSSGPATASRPGASARRRGCASSTRSCPARTSPAPATTSCCGRSPTTPPCRRAARALEAHGYRTHEFGDFVWLTRVVHACYAAAPGGHAPTGLGGVRH